MKLLFQRRSLSSTCFAKMMFTIANFYSEFDWHAFGCNCDATNFHEFYWLVFGNKRVKLLFLLFVLLSEIFKLIITKGLFPQRAWKRAFFVSFIDLRLKRAVEIEASAKKSNKTKNAFFHARTGNGP